MHATRPLTVLHVAVPAVAGGLESVLLQLTSGLRGLGHRLVLAAVVSSAAADHPLLRRARELGVEVLPIVVPPRSYRQEAILLRNAIRAVRPDLIHTHGYRADLLGGFAARRAAVPWVATVHGFTGGDRKNRLYEWLQVRAYRWAHAVVAVSKPIQERLVSEGVRRERVRLLPNAWSPSPFLDRRAARSRLDLAENAFVIGWVGRLSHEKGADVFLEALAQLRDLPWIASVVGDGVEREALKRQAEILGIGSRIRWHGIQAEAAALYTAFDVFVLSSRTEGTPMVLLEAVAACVSVVATEVGGVPEMFPEDEVFLIPSERPDELSNVLRRIHADPEGAHLRCDAAFKTLAARFDLASWLAAHEDLYRGLLPQRGSTV